MTLQRIILLVLLFGPLQARAADPDQTMPTVLPWTGTQLNLDESNSYLAFSLNRQFFGGAMGPLRLGLRVTTPIEGKNRVVTSRRNPAHFNFGYNVKLSLTWDTTYWARYDLPLSPILRREICPKLQPARSNKARCHALAVDRWRRDPANRKKLEEWRKARTELTRASRQWDRKHHALQLQWYQLRQQLVQVTAQRMTPTLMRHCRHLTGQPKKRPNATTKPIDPRSINAYRRAVSLLQARARLARRCSAHIRLQLLAQEQKITTETHAYERRVSALRRKIALSDALRALPIKLRQRQSQPLATHLFPSAGYTRRAQLYWAAGLEFFLAYDNISLYRFRASQQLESMVQSSIQFGPTATLYFAPYAALTLRVGLEFSKEVEIDLRERCDVQDQGNQRSTQFCEDAYFLVAHPWYTRLYIRGALTSMFQFEAITLGAELRFGLENIGLDNFGEGTLFDARLVLFSLARTKSIYGRFNVGLGLVHVFGPTRRQRFLPGTTAVVPFVGVGGGF